MLKEWTNHISSCAREEKKKKDLHTGTDNRKGGMEAHKGAMFLLEDIFRFCWRTTPFSVCPSHIWTDQIQGEVCWKGLAKYLFFTVLTLISTKILPFFDTEIISFLTFTWSTLAVRRLRVLSPSPQYKEIVLVLTLNSQWFLHCKKLW